MNLIQVMIPSVNDVMAGFGQQTQIGQQILERVKSFIPKIEPAWIGTDREAYSQQVLTRMVPAKLEWIAALAGQRLDLGKALDVVQKADQAVNSAVSQLSSVFSAI